MVDPRVEAAGNNAGWCDAVCRALALPTRWTADAWAATRRSPNGYPYAVALSRSADPAVMLSLVGDGPGCSVKDGFAVLDLEPWGFHAVRGYLAPASVG